jgi:hypothetical protein
MTIKCACRDERCHTTLKFVDNMLEIERKDASKADFIAIYVDANTLIQLIAEARHALASMAEEAGRYS